MSKEGGRLARHLEGDGGVQLAVDVDGEGEPALVFVHGWCCTRTHWAGQMAAFRDRHRVVALDLGGHGDSTGDRAEWTIESFGRDVVAAADALDLQKMILIGHSMGGPVIVDAATRLGERVVGLVGADTFQQMARVRTPEQVDQRVAPFMEKRFRERARPFAASMFVDSSDPDLVERTVEGMASTRQEVAVEALWSLSLQTQELQQQLKALKPPVVTINAATQNTDVDAARAYGINVRFLEGVGHFVMMEDAEGFSRILEEVVGEMG